MPSLAKFLIPNKFNPRKSHLLPTPLTTPPPSSNVCASSQFQEPHWISPSSIFHRLRCTTSPAEARKLHCLLVVNGLLHQNHSVVLGAQLVNTYVGLGRLQDALMVFDHTPRRNLFAWNSILKGFIDVGRFSEVLEVYHSMLREGLIPDNFTYPLVLKACSGLSALEEGREVLESIKINRIHHNLEPNIFVQCAAIDMFSKCGSLNEARKMFDEMPLRDLISWSAMICGTMQVGDWAEALRMFCRMTSEGFGLDSVIFATVLPACGRLGHLVFGTGLQCCAIKSGIDSDLCLLNALVDMYCKCGHTRLAHHLFRCMNIKDVVSWSSLMAGYSQNCEYAKSLDLFTEMIRSDISPSSVTLASVLPGFAKWKLLKEGKGIHSYAIRHGFDLDTFVASALMDLYCQCGSLSEAEIIFKKMSGKDIAIWNSMIAGYALGGDVDSVFLSFRRIQEVHIKPDCITVLTVLPLCSRFTMLSQGKELHSYITRSGLSSETSVSNTLIDMYCKCGCLGLGEKVFEQMIERNIVTYNTIIASVGMHGHAVQAISYFNRMGIERINPDKVTFIALLSACSHAGLIDKGLMFYNSMVDEYGILPDMEHYSCMVDLYGRSGYLDDAWEFIQKMPVEPDIDVLGSLLGACRVHKRTELAALVGKWIFEKKPEDPGYYILLSNIYTAEGRWEDGIKVRTMMKEQGLTKNPGTSRIQIGCSTYSFVARSRLNDPDPLLDNICRIIENLIFQMKDEGYSPDVSTLQHVDEENGNFTPGDF